MGLPDGQHERHRSVLTLQRQAAASGTAVLLPTHNQAAAGQLLAAMLGPRAQAHGVQCPSRGRGASASDRPNLAICALKSSVLTR